MRWFCRNNPESREYKVNDLLPDEYLVSKEQMAQVYAAMSGYGLPRKNRNRMSSNFHEKIAKITDTFLGYGPHGIFTLYLTLDFGKGVTGSTPPFTLGPYASALIEAVLDVCNVDRWEHVKGHTVYALLDRDDISGEVTGLAPLPTEKGTPFLFHDVFDEAKKKMEVAK